MSKQQASNTVPVVETDGLGGHVPYTLPDKTPTSTYTSAENALLAVLTEILETLQDVRDEARATRLALQEYVNAGDPAQTDFLEMAQSIRDSFEEA